jgi:AhpD family alkylhydroperoxidase
VKGGSVSPKDDAESKPPKNFRKMSKHAGAKHQRCEGAKFCVSITNKNEIRKRESKMKTIQPRMKNPAMLIPEAMQPLMAFVAAVRKGGAPQRTLDLVHLRASQINGCSCCVDMGSRELKKGGETDDRLFSLAAWREAPFFTEVERAALGLAEAITRLSDRSDPVPEEIWNEATLHYDEKSLAALILWIATTNLFNRINATTKQVAGDNQWNNHSKAQHNN